MEDGALHCRQQARAATDPCRHFPAQPLLEGRHHRLQGDHPHPIVLIFPHIVGAEKEAMTAQKTDMRVKEEFQVQREVPLERADHCLIEEEVKEAEQAKERGEKNQKEGLAQEREPTTRIL